MLRSRSIEIRLNRKNYAQTKHGYRLKAKDVARLVN